ncbi:MAG: hypothetical protein ACPHVX_01860 [Flavobacteriaceae bacterium]
MKLFRFAQILLFPLVLLAQEKEITNEEIWNFDFSVKSLQEIHPLSSVSQYSVLELDPIRQISKVIAYDYATANLVGEIVNSSSILNIKNNLNVFKRITFLLNVLLFLNFHCFIDKKSLN